MNKFKTEGIILGRTNFGEADRILTFLTPDHGKVRAIAKGVRKLKSKLAGGIELFSVSQLSVLVGKGEINTIVSTRLLRHYGNIVKDLERTDTAYEILKLINKNTEDQPEAAYFELLDTSLASLDDVQLDTSLVKLWFAAQLLKLAGHAPNLKTDTQGKALEENLKYDFDIDKMCFRRSDRAVFQANDIKFLRLVFSAANPKVLQKVNNTGKLTNRASKIVSLMVASYAKV